MMKVNKYHLDLIIKKKREIEPSIQAISYLN